MKHLQEEFNLSYLIISHDLAVIEHMCDRVCVMYLGRFVEIADDTEIISNPLHPYTKALLSAVYEPDPKQKQNRTLLTGDVPSPIKPPPGCHFHTRCSYVKEICQQQNPPLVELSLGHLVACHLYNS